MSNITRQENQVNLHIIVIKNMKVLIIVCMIFLTTSLEISAQTENRQLSIKDSSHVAALKYYLQLIKQENSHLVSGHFVILVSEKQSEMNEITFDLGVVKSNYYKYSPELIIGYFYLENHLFIVEHNSHFLNNDSRVIKDIDALIEDKLDKYIPSKTIDVFIKRNGITIPVQEMIPSNLVFYSSYAVKFGRNGNFTFLRQL